MDPRAAAAVTLFLSPAALDARRTLLRDPAALGGLAASLQQELHAALDVPVPAGKSRLTRAGGRCLRCTVLLAFDPRAPYAHTCPQCGAVYTDQVHHEWWLMNGHLWTAEQATRAAALAALMDDARAARRADEILDAYAARYLQWPNRDNALGPTRPFFSTYLESIWLLHLVTALDLREAGVAALPATAGARIRDQLIEPSARLIASFDEGRSNRQAWHCAALLAAAAVLDDAPLRDGAAAALRRLLADGLHRDGSWYEGENYHLFAHRGLLTAITIAEHSGVEMPSALVSRLDAGFAAPFRTMLPDGTFPARRDSQYGISLRQYRTADWLECGLARHDTPALRAALAMQYAEWPALGETGRAVSTADAERNQPSVRLTRADCSWRALLLATPELPPLSDASPTSELLEGQGLAVFRRDAGRFWIALDYGDPGAGHGHPDRLNLLVATRDARWLDDVGTGSYTAPTLAWYRSSLAHNAPLVNGTDQGAAAGWLVAHDEQGDIGWASAAFRDPVSGVQFRRTIVVLHDHLLDELSWESEDAVTVDLPLQAAALADADSAGAEARAQRAWQPVCIVAPQAAWLQNPVACDLAAGAVISLTCTGLPSPAAPDAGRVVPNLDFRVQLWSDTAAVVWRAGTIGPPAGTPHALVSLRQQGVRGRSVRLIMATDASLALHVDAATISVTDATGDATRHRRVADGWEVRPMGGRTVTLRGCRPVPAPSAPPTEPAGATHLRVPARSVASMELGETHYRGTEESWREAGAPTAMIGVHDMTPDARIIAVGVRLGRSPAFARFCDENPLDNELADVNSDGVQLHWRGTGGAWNGVLAVPEDGRVRLTVASGSLEGLTAECVLEATGFRIIFTMPWLDPHRALEFDCCVNERPAGRERRRGQLVLSGAFGESAYLRGARQDSARALHVAFDQAQP